MKKHRVYIYRQLCLHCLSKKLSQIRQMVEGWIALAPDQPQRIDETVGMTLQQIMSIF